MYGAHHRVASLRPGAGDRISQRSATPHPTQTAESLSATPRWPPYSVPAPLRHSRLAGPHSQPQQPQSQTQTQQPQSQTQTQQQPLGESPDILAAVRGVSEALAQQRPHVAAGCRSLALIGALVDGQRAQTAALERLADEVRAVAGAIRETGKPAEKRARESGDENMGRAEEKLLVLGGNDSEEEGGDEDSGAAFAKNTQLRPVLLRNTRRAAAFVEDDVFSM